MIDRVGAEEISAPHPDNGKSPAICGVVEEAESADWYTPCIAIAPLGRLQRSDEMTMRLIGRMMTTCLCTVALAAPVARGQNRQIAPFATRTALQARIADADAAARNASSRKEWADNVADLNSVRERLRDGDFNVGDRVVLRVANVPSLTDTFTVRGGRVLELPDIGSVPLTGVLWSELTPYLTTQLARYVVNPSVEAHPLVRVSVAGQVSKPGFYAIRPDMLVSDAIMDAGGVSAQGNLDATSIRRNGKELWTAKHLRQEIASGATVDKLDLRAGDEIYVGEQTKRDWADILRTGAYVGAVIASVYGGTRIF
jgi:protein involved in polysaccharide export with SLBB domain